MRKYLSVNMGSIVPIFFSALSILFITENYRNQTIFVSIISIIGYFLTIKLIPFVKELCLKANLYGRDINKNSDEKV